LAIETDSNFGMFLK